MVSMHPLGSNNSDRVSEDSHRSSRISSWKEGVDPTQLPTHDLLEIIEKEEESRLTMRASKMSGSGNTTERDSNYVFNIMNSRVSTAKRDEVLKEAERNEDQIM